MDNINFERPTIVGALCRDPKEISGNISFRLSRHAKKIAYLPFVVEPKHLKNTVACMLLMDVHSLTVGQSLQAKIIRHLPSVSDAALALGAVDIVARKGKKFLGLNSQSETILEFLASGKNRGSSALLVGAHPLIPVFKKVLPLAGWKVEGRIDKVPRLIVMGNGGKAQRVLVSGLLRSSKALHTVVNLTGKGFPSRKNTNVFTDKDFQKLHFDTAVRLLTAGV